MKKLIYMLLTFVVFISFPYSQERDSLIQLYSGIGDTIDFIDREIFDLYPDIEGYKYAQLFSRDKKFLISNINYSNGGRLCDTILVEDISTFYNMRFQLSQFVVENEKEFASPNDAFVLTNTGNKFYGKLKMFSKRYLYLNSDFNYLTGNSSGFDYKTPLSQVDSIQIAIKPNVGPYVGYGALGGFALGLIAGIATFNDDAGADKEIKWLAASAIGAAAGLLIGWLIGESLPPDFVNIRFSTPYDVIKLKDYSAYYFQYDKTLEEKYVKLK